MQRAFATDKFRVYSSDDVVGVEMGGALKNVIAIAAGVIDGLGFGHNSRAGLITRGLSEIGKLAASAWKLAERVAGCYRAWVILPDMHGRPVAQPDRGRRARQGPQAG
ncbi:MAG: hypothetical protein U0414_20780 [Polyangiaceae bacterium]